jgi:hydrogenase expression/formation protein HypE
MDHRPFRIAAVLFDFDGTLTVPDTLDFAAVRRAVGCPRGVGLLEHLAGVADAQERRDLEAVLEAWEIEAAARTRENAGATELVRTLHGLGVPLGIITRNTRESIDRSLAQLPGIDPGWFGVIVTRDLPFSPKPLPDGVHYAAGKLGVDVGELLVVGDYLFDIEAGKAAGALAMYLHNDPSGPFHGESADFVVHSLTEALEVIRRGLPAPARPPAGAEPTAGGLSAAEAARS